MNKINLLTKNHIQNDKKTENRTKCDEKKKSESEFWGLIICKKIC